ncbi:MAG TPA: ASCH domain-containing protein [Dongiaceae bacterium]|nr:ASCH domain-containing protein [Dongiaceae bacterium]
MRQRDFWQAACSTVPGLPPTADYQVWHFGDSEKLARDLADLVLRGPKRATAGLLWEAELDASMMPVQGGYSLVTDHAGAPLLIIRTTQVEVRPYDKVDADFAAAEGEGDGSLAYWRDAHWRYFSRRCATLGRTPSNDMPVVLERFALVYPVGRS